ncbi:CoA transferase [Georgenia alba]|uniref:CoA transferase n=1 Tax=Georgenia alba TaxID=2233858 RepID=A0ABW2Q6P5_9MICO
MEDEPVEVTGPRRWWAGPLDVEGLALDAVTACASAGARLARARGRPVRLGVDAGDVAAAYDSFRHLRVDGRAITGFAPLSSFVPAADGWVRFHANYPHHRRALLTALEIDPDLDDETAAPRVRDAARGTSAVVLEDLVRRAGGIAAALRDPGEWLEHDQGRAVAAAPLVEVRQSHRPGRALPAATGLPTSGLRVLDLTRVIAGPTATRVLGALGADVLRLDPPHRPELLDQHLDTGFAKRSAVADLTDPAVRDRVERLLGSADALVTGYRPGALRTHGLDAEEVLGRHPHLVVAELSAWGFDGPWSTQRGFDSIVQVATGIAHRYATDAAPGALPVQALDHTAGYLLAGAVMQALATRDDGGARVRVSLARVAHELQSRTAVDAEPAPAPPVRTRTVDSAYGPLVHVPPPLRVDGSPLTYPAPPRPYGQDELRWAA